MKNAEVISEIIIDGDGDIYLLRFESMTYMTVTNILQLQFLNSYCKDILYHCVEGSCVRDYFALMKFVTLY